jgi:hypothetical protein
MLLYDGLKKVGYILASETVWNFDGSMLGDNADSIREYEISSVNHSMMCIVSC